MKFCKQEYGKNKTERSAQIGRECDIRAPPQRCTTNTKLYNIFSKVKDFGPLPEIIELTSPVNIKDKDELISSIREHPASIEEIRFSCKKVLFVTDEEVKRIETETRNRSCD